jgi:WD40 repeat protein
MHEIPQTKATLHDTAFVKNLSLAANVCDSPILGRFAHNDSVYGAQFSRDESKVLTWSVDHTARLWDLTTLKLLQTFKHDDRVDGATFSRDESQVLTWSIDMTARLWDVTKPEPTQIFRHEDPVSGARFSGDESHLLTWGGGRERGEACLWDVTNAKPILRCSHKGIVRGAQLGTDGTRVLTWSSDRTARVWSIATAEPIQTFNHQFEIVDGCNRTSARLFLKLGC